MGGRYLADLSAVSAAAKVLELDLSKTLNAYGVAGATAPLPNTQKWGWNPKATEYIVFDTSGFIWFIGATSITVSPAF